MAAECKLRAPLDVPLDVVRGEEAERDCVRCSAPLDARCTDHDEVVLHEQTGAVPTPHVVELKPLPAYYVQSEARVSSTLRGSATATASLRQRHALVRYEQPSSRAHDAAVLYDADADDYEFAARAQLDVALVERVMDRLEKWSAYEQVQLEHSAGTVHPIDEEDVACAVCMELDSTDANQIVFCDGCNLPVHQECYGVEAIPSGMWLCRACESGCRSNVACPLCPNTQGAFTRLKEPFGRYEFVHVACALWIPGVSFGNAAKMEDVVGIEKVEASRFHLRCSVCKLRDAGACVQCMHPRCAVPFHVTCGHSAGMQIELRDDDDGVEFLAYCRRHSDQSRFRRSAVFHNPAFEAPRLVHCVSLDCAQAMFGSVVPAAVSRSASAAALGGAPSAPATATAAPAVPTAAAAAAAAAAAGAGAAAAAAAASATGCEDAERMEVPRSPAPADVGADVCAVPGPPIDVALASPARSGAVGESRATAAAEPEQAGGSPDVAARPPAAGDSAPTAVYLAAAEQLTAPTAPNLSSCECATGCRDVQRADGSDREAPQLGSGAAAKAALSSASVLAPPVRASGAQLNPFDVGIEPVDGTVVAQVYDHWIERRKNMRGALLPHFREVALEVFPPPARAAPTARARAAPPPAPTVPSSASVTPRTPGSRAAGASRSSSAARRAASAAAERRARPVRPAGPTHADLAALQELRIQLEDDRTFVYMNQKRAGRQQRLLQCVTEQLDELGAIQQKMQARWKREVVRTLERIMSHRYAFIFLHPVNPTAFDPPLTDYFAIVKEPMDLGTVLQRVESGAYDHVDAVERDVLLTFSNCIEYNGDASNEASVARVMRDFAVEAFQRLRTSLADAPGRIRAALAIDEEALVVPEHVWGAEYRLLDVVLRPPTPPPPAAASRRAGRAGLGEDDDGDDCGGSGCSNSDEGGDGSGDDATRAASSRARAKRGGSASRAPAARSKKTALASARSRARQPDAWRDRVRRVVERLTMHPSAFIFLEPVDPMSFDPPLTDYASIVKQPMDLGTVLKRLAGGEYAHMDAVERDVMLTFDNCIEYNGDDSYEAGLARAVRARAAALFGKLREWLSGAPGVAEHDDSDDGGDTQPRSRRRDAKRARGSAAASRVREDRGSSSRGRHGSANNGGGSGDDSTGSSGDDSDGSSGSGSGSGSDSGSSSSSSSSSSESTNEANASESAASRAARRRASSGRRSEADTAGDDGAAHSRQPRAARRQSAGSAATRRQPNADRSAASESPAKRAHASASAERGVARPLGNVAAADVVVLTTPSSSSTSSSPSSARRARRTSVTAVAAVAAVAVTAPVAESGACGDERAALARELTAEGLDGAPSAPTSPDDNASEDCAVTPRTPASTAGAGAGAADHALSRQHERKAISGGVDSSAARVARQPPDRTTSGVAGFLGPLASAESPGCDAAAHPPRRSLLRAGASKRSSSGATEAGAPRQLLISELFGGV